MPNKKWSRDYAGFESIMDFYTEHVEDALDAIVPNSEWAGTIRITFEYLEEQNAPANNPTKLYQQRGP